jgi:hypothetical protein
MHVALLARPLHAARCMQLTQRAQLPVLAAGRVGSRQEWALALRTQHRYAS